LKVKGVLEMDEKLKIDIINDFEEYCIYMTEFMNKNINEQSIFETISDYVGSLYYELLDNLQEERKNYGIDEDLTDYEAIIEIEDLITKTLIESEVA
jgi:hypothetical protein